MTPREDSMSLQGAWKSGAPHREAGTAEAALQSP
jgi:hypothetical protein